MNTPPDTRRRQQRCAQRLAVLALIALPCAMAQGNPFLQPAPAARPSGPAATPPPNPFAAAVNKATAAPAASPAAAPAAPAAPALGPGLVSLEQKNVFDPDRKIWPDRVPPPPPPPPPPAPAPVTEQEVQLYGTVLVNGIKRATVRLGGRFASMTQGGRPYAHLSEGQPLGEYTVSQIQPTQIVLTAGATQQTIVFTKKTDRPAATLVPPVIQSGVAAAGASPTPAPAVAPQSSAPDAPPGGAPSAAPVAPAVPVPPMQPYGAVGGGSDNGPGAPAAPVNSLAAAIAAAQAAAAQGGRQPTANPFLPK